MKANPRKPIHPARARTAAEYARSVDPWFVAFSKKYPIKAKAKKSAPSNFYDSAGKPIYKSGSIF